MENPFSIFVDLGKLFPNFLMPGVQQFLGGTKPIGKQFASTPFFEMVEGVGIVEHW